MLTTLSSRKVFALIALACALAMGFAFFLEHQLDLAPCPLCMTQRAFVVLVGLIALAAAAHGPLDSGRKIYAGAVALVAFGGGAVAVRHIWLTYLPEDQVPACGPSLSYMLETLPFSETLQLVFMGDGNCAEVDWTLLGLSIPEQTLALFLALAAAGIWLAIRSEPRGGDYIKPLRVR
jgi:protein dithiol:quinone oxidoreductase